MGTLEDIVKIVDQVVEENLADFYDEEATPKSGSKKSGYFDSSHNKQPIGKPEDDLDDWDLNGDPEDWLEIFDEILKAEETDEPKKSEKSATPEIKTTASVKPAAIALIGGGVLFLGLVAGFSTMAIKKRSVKYTKITTLPVRTTPELDDTKVQEHKGKYRSPQLQVVRPAF